MPLIDSRLFECTKNFCKVKGGEWSGIPEKNDRLVILIGFCMASPLILAKRKLTLNTSEFVRNNWDGMAREVALDLALDIRDQLRAISRPTLVIGCTHDYIVPMRQPRQLVTWIPVAEYAELATEHLAALEQPEACAALISNF